jgi:hypothetical protein
MASTVLSYCASFASLVLSTLAVLLDSDVTMSSSRAPHAAALELANFGYLGAPVGHPVLALRARL